MSRPKPRKTERSEHLHLRLVQFGQWLIQQANRAIEKDNVKSMLPEHLAMIVTSILLYFLEKCAFSIDLLIWLASLTQRIGG